MAELVGVKPTLYDGEIVHKSCLDRDNPRAVINVIPQEDFLLDALQENIEDISEHFSDTQFNNKYGQGKKRPEYGIMRRLRHQFWLLYNEAQGDHKNARPGKIALNRIHRGICTLATLKKLLKDPLNAIFMFTQPQNIRKIQQDLLYEGYRVMEDVILADNYNRDGTVNTKLIDQKLKIIQMIENRVSGSVVQRIQTHNEHNHTGDPATQKEQIEDLSEKVARLKKELGKNSDDIEDAVVVEK